MKELNDIETIIIKSLDQTASDAELHQLKQWLKAVDTNKASYYQLKDVWDATAHRGIPDASFAWKQVNARLKDKNKISKWVVELMKIAAVALIVAVASYSLLKVPSSMPEPVSLSRVIVPNGSQSTVILADGSTVKLNAGSELVYPSQFDDAERKVELKGEAYFQVKHNAHHPFIVSAGELDVKVLGTEFNVMAYPDADRIETTLVTGSVALNTKGADQSGQVFLRPGQKAIFKDGHLDVSPANLEMETTWTEKGFYFQSTSFEELVRRLERWYDVDIVIDNNAFEDITFTGKFRNKESIWQVLDVIKMTTPINYKAKEGKIYITLINQ